MITIDIRWLKTFIVAAEFENFRKAAEQLLLTQPAVTKHIRRLEEYLHVRLFERNGKNVMLTEAGYKFLPYAKQIVKEFEKGLNDFAAWKQGYSRKLTIAAAPQIASSFLPPLLREFIEQNGDMEVFVNVVKSYEIGAEVNSGKADLGLSRIKPLQTDLIVEKIHEERVVFVGSSLLGKNEDLHESEILHHYRLITHNHPDYWDLLLNDIKRHYPHVRTMVVSQGEVTKKFIENGLGVSYLPYSMVKEEILQGRLIEIPPEKVKLPKSVTYVITKIGTEEAKSFIHFLKKKIPLNHGGF